MKTFTFCLLIYVLLVFYSCNNSVENEPIDMTDDRGTFLVNTSSDMYGLCWSADNSEIYCYTDRLYAVNIATKIVRIIDNRISNYQFDRNLILSNDGGKIFYVNYFGNGNSVYSIGTNGQNLREIVSDVTSNELDLSTDNNYIAYSKHSRINIYKISDSTNREYTLSYASPLSFSPDGSELMCKSTDTSVTKIYRMNVSTGTYQILLTLPNSYLSSLSCSSWETDAFKMLYQGVNYNKNYLYNSATNTSIPIFTRENGAFFWSYPALNIGSTRAAFWTRKWIYSYPDEANQLDLYLVNLNTLQSSLVSKFMIPGIFFSSSTTCIAFSNDGSKIAYSNDNKIYMRVLQ